MHWKLEKGGCGYRVIESLAICSPVVTWKIENVPYDLV